MNMENGPNIGGKIIDKSYFDQNGNEIIIKNNTILFFISIYCVRCIQIMPFIKKISNSKKVDFVLFSNGSHEDHKEMISRFKWKFPIIAIDDEHLERDFFIKTHPFFLIVDNFQTVYKKGTINNLEELKSIFHQKKGIEMQLSK
ncbi:hypothetical protein MHI32_09525 [Paenibacillus sp. FSL H7-0690]|uniref:TlpA family protein disulfide reductase n=1 Tax=Paenibacillus sp. FSL H7-0690 TaxID=2921437 RepID=UPI0030EDF2E6